MVTACIVALLHCCLHICIQLTATLYFIHCPHVPLSLSKPHFFVGVACTCVLVTCACNSLIHHNSTNVICSRLHFDNITTFALGCMHVKKYRYTCPNFIHVILMFPVEYSLWPNVLWRGLFCEVECWSLLCMLSCHFVLLTLLVGPESGINTWQARLYLAIHTHTYLHCSFVSLISLLYFYTARKHLHFSSINIMLSCKIHKKSNFLEVYMYLSEHFTSQI